MSKKKTTLSLNQLFAYGAANCGQSLIFASASFLLSSFYVDYFEMESADIFLINIIVLIFMIVMAPVFGIINDKVNTKWGHNRHYWLFLGIPFAILFVLMFFAPELEESAKFVWALITYLLFGLCFVGIVVPIYAILARLSEDDDDRILANTFSCGGFVLGAFISCICLENIVPVIGWQISSIIFAVVGLGLLIYAFIFTREQEIAAEPFSVGEIFSSVKGNLPWLLITLFVLFFFIGNGLKVSCSSYYSQYILDDLSFSNLLNYFSAFQLLGIAAVPFLTRKISKNFILSIAIFVTAIFQILLFFSGLNEVIISVLWILSSISSGVCIAIPIVMLVDSVYASNKANGVFAPGFLMSIGVVLAMQLSSLASNLISNLSLSNAGLVPGAIQTGATLDTIQICFSLVPAGFFILAGIITFLYIKFEK